MGDGLAKDELHFAVEDVTVCEFDDVFEEAVCFFELVPEGKVVLRELEAFEIILFDDYRPQDVQPRKEPASAAFFLVCNAFCFNLVAEDFVVPAQYVAIQSETADVIIRDGIVHRPGVGIYFKR